MDERTPPWDIDGPVQAEVYDVWLDGDHIAWTGPCGPAPWLLELGAADHPLEVVDRIVRDTIGPPLLVHSTSWRRDRDAVILSFVVVIEPLVGRWRACPSIRWTGYRWTGCLTAQAWYWLGRADVDDGIRPRSYIAP